ncbi:MAG: hypothetical protein H0U76_09380 [Ktedonobacteraceae bacterium]|nr:hypothetical protein [Ktedonobacteraceae bacterium]
MPLIQIDYALTFDALFHLGAGVSAGLVDRTVIRNASGYVYVPASTLKGVLREHCEQLCRFYTGDGNAQSAGVHVPNPHNPRDALMDFGNTQTLIGHIFGTSLHPGNMRFNDATQVDTHLYASRDRANQDKGIYKAMQISTLTQARIDRLTHTAVDAALYTSEFGIPNLTFIGTIKGQVPSTSIEGLTRTVHEQETAHTLTPTYSLLLLLAGLLMVERLGGNKSTGKGQCTCIIEEVKLDKVLCPEAIWQEWVANLHVLSDYLDGQQGGQA